MEADIALDATWKDGGHVWDRSQPSMGPLTLLQSYDLSLFHFIPTVSSNPQYVLFLLSAEVPAAHLPEELEAITRDIP